MIYFKEFNFNIVYILFFLVFNINAIGGVEENNLNNSKDFRKIKNRKIKPKKPKRNNFNNTLYSDNFFSRHEKVDSNRSSSDLSKPNSLNYVKLNFEKADKNFNYINSNENQSGSNKAHCSKYMPSSHNSNENKSRLAILSETDAELSEKEVELSVTEAEDLLQKINSLEEDEIKKMESFKLNLDKARKNGFISAFVKVLFVFFNNKNGFFVFEHVDGINEEIRNYSFDSSIKICNIFREDERIKYVAFNVLYNKDKKKYSCEYLVEKEINQNHRGFTKLERFIKFCKSLIKLVFPCVPYNNEPQNQDEDSENQRMI